MIHVDPQPEPKNFDSEVRQPGLGSLQTGRLDPHWRKCLPDLWRLYGGICAYSCLYIPPVTGDKTVDHFVAKSSQPALAYEWSNYRLACSRMNTKKGRSDDVLDPFQVIDGWFHLNLLSLEVYPNPDAPPDIIEKVQATIDRLGLNDSESRQGRQDYMDGYDSKEIDLSHLRRYSPFVFREMQRQGKIP